MQRVVSLLLLCLGVPFLVSAGDRGDAVSREQTIVIRVTSAQPGVEQTFDAAWVFDEGDTSLQHVERTTPFEIRQKARFVSAIIRKKDDGGNIEVVLTTVRQDGTEQKHVAGSGELIVLGTNPQYQGRFSVQAIDPGFGAGKADRR